MLFIININEALEGESQTVHQVETYSNNPRTNKRKLREYFIAMGVRKWELKRVFTAMGFTTEALTGVDTDESTKSTTLTH